MFMQEFSKKNQHRNLTHHEKKEFLRRQHQRSFILFVVFLGLAVVFYILAFVNL
ncbi:hypothetical protein COMNV_01496 [Commensalibacter sp. Nvir]|nr:hypothetical protein COMNV_01496 [Commensalibacter sp. Nvir]